MNYNITVWYCYHGDFFFRQSTTKCRQCPGYVPPPTLPATGIIQTGISMLTIRDIVKRRV
jgi:hypothetical protein